MSPGQAAPRGQQVVSVVALPAMRRSDHEEAPGGLAGRAGGWNTAPQSKRCGFDSRPGHTRKATAGCFSLKSIRTHPRMRIKKESALDQPK